MSSGPWRTVTIRITWFSPNSRTTSFATRFWDWAPAIWKCKRWVETATRPGVSPERTPKKLKECGMTTKVAINGLGRIGRAILKLAVDEPSIEVVAVNDLVDVENLAYLLRFDTVYGRYSKPVTIDGQDLVVAGRKLRTLSEHNPLNLPWKELGVELVFECTGALTRREDLAKHIRAGARVVLL